jgi:pectinesterase
MATSSSWIKFAVVLFALPVFWGTSVECSSRGEIGPELKVDSSTKDQLFRPPNEAEIADFEAWVAREGKSYLEKKAALEQIADKPTVDASSSTVRDSSYVGSTYIVVDQNGHGQFSTVQSAIDSIPKDQTRTTPITIQVNPGTYHEKVIIAKNLPYLTIQGGGRGNTLIVNAETKGEAGSDIADATVAISAPNFVARNITFQNSSPAPPSGAVGQQATAVYVSGDMAAFYGVGFLGAQDTLYDHSGRHVYSECFIEGSIDFIYGDARSYFKNTQLNVIPTATGSLTAQKRMSAAEDTGFSFVDCTVTGNGQVYLGRAWGPYSRTVFIQTWMADIIIPAGWMDWNDPTRDATVYYGEYDCYGPGSSTSGRVSWAHELTAEQAAPFMDLSFVDGEYWAFG